MRAAGLAKPSSQKSAGSVTLSRMAQLRWSEDPREVVSHCLAGNAVAFSVERRLALVATRRVDFLVVPLRDVVRLDRADERAPLGPAQADHWLIWQSLTERGC